MITIFISNLMYYKTTMHNKYVVLLSLVFFVGFILNDKVTITIVENVFG